MAEMAAITFPAYGSLYFADASLDSKYKIELGDGSVLARTVAHGIGTLAGM
jgi:hypothetical protein